MDLQLFPSTLNGCINAPASKSQCHRALLCAALSDSPTTIVLDRLSEDTAATYACLKEIGRTNHITLKTYTGQLIAPPTSPDSPTDCKGLLNCSESGSTLRFLLPIVSALGISCALTGCKRLSERPLSPLYEELVSHGVVLSPMGQFPLHVSGHLSGGHFSLPGNISSQYISGLLFALPLVNEDSIITITGKTESKPYLDLTVSILRTFGIIISEQRDGYLIRGGQKYTSPGLFSVEGDWSNAAFWLTAGAMSPYGVSCTGLSLSSKQGDQKILPILQQFGAYTEVMDNRVFVRKNELHGITIDASDIPDLVPILSVAAAAAKGNTRILHCERLRMKESDRMETTRYLLSALGVTMKTDNDSILISGTGKLVSDGTLISSFNDHRIAMSAAIAALSSTNEFTLSNAEAVNKSYPDFFSQYTLLGGVIKRK